MPMDAVCLRAVVEEIRPQVLGLRIDKVHQPARDQVILLLRGNHRLLLNAGANAPRIHLTGLSRENPAEPPMFCMLLRKHVIGSRILAITQPTLERLVRIELSVTDEFGRPGRRTLVLEAMGRRSNLILLDGDGRIIDCMRRVDAEMSASRQVLPGLFYEPPASTGRLPVVEETGEGFFEKLRGAPEDQLLAQFLLDHYFGISPLLAREIAFQTCKYTDGRLLSLGEDGRRHFWEVLEQLIKSIKENRFTPILLKRNGQYLDFSCLPVFQYEQAVETEYPTTFSSLLDQFYAARETQDRIRQRGADLLKTAASARDRVRRKLDLQKKDYSAVQDRQELRLYGDLITANLYRMERGQRELVCENYWAENALVHIPLDPLLTPQQNATKYYKRYTKAKTAEKYLREQMEKACQDIEYLESILQELQLAESEQDFLDIRAELRESGFLRQKGKKEKERPSKPRELHTSSGYLVLVGRNNRQNDFLTLKKADWRDLWFHTQKIHGSHVILCTRGESVDEATISEAAQIAAYYSQGRESGNVPVDYTQVKNVKKPAGARPGMVIYSTCRTVYVNPSEELIRSLTGKKQ